MEYLKELYQQHIVLAWYLLVINFLTFFFYGVDKAKSAAKAWRISERTLLIMALVGGSIGAMTGIKLFRHKTQKNSFLAWLAIILILQITLVYFLITHYAI
ncbi:MAG: DUF1294 domain-containing protein [Candidatus Magasanikbacteria bacterium CG10_big_fil_rev_8_21_14_0_10_36_32]|uniref:DUF1294 domain-containing protein n=1 Tax=Candidatus Magasanikbacteria bacterium CG10_big_fil_rev_8_21_14_0_10_36_32 TaxID=1974646 RepID=A0A2M6W769_9BACT|nr:MAG: DUF1294 domain-containing protein [Candidatus Magasanikbacteria bacterium CG10_big_fil_rev_8_21_14_0_10_36_32]